MQAPGTRIMLGFAAAALALLLSYFLAGAGHGWVTPLRASILLWALTPAALIFAWPAEGPSPKILLPLILVAVLADAWLIKSTIAEDNALPFYLEVNGLVGFLIVGLWIGLWLFWQGVVIASLFVRKAGND